MQFGADVDLAEMAVRYKFTSGLIKNTLLMAAGYAMLHSNEKETVILGRDALHKAARHQAKSIFDLGSIGHLSTPGKTLADLPVRRADRDRLDRIAAIIPAMQQKKMGLFGLICSENIQLGLDCVEAVAAENNLMLRRFSLSRLFAGGNLPGTRSGKILDPFT